MENAMSRRKRILLTGNCEYELLGLSHLLAGMGYAVVRPEMSPPGAYDLALVALSAEPLAGWGGICRTSECCTRPVRFPWLFWYLRGCRKCGS